MLFVALKPIFRSGFQTFEVESSLTYTSRNSLGKTQSYTHLRTDIRTPSRNEGLSNAFFGSLARRLDLYLKNCLKNNDFFYVSFLVHTNTLPERTLSPVPRSDRLVG